MAKVVKQIQKPISNAIVTPNDLGEQILYQRTKLGMSREEAASLCGINYKTLENIEKGNPNTKIGNVLGVAKMLGIKLGVGDTDA
ncbi:MAG: helix-turn-helix transcriptional regulator [Arcobacter sp.]|nr:helix-turn-helix transcriptional regulator [Arcobacter sp.]